MAASRPNNKAQGNARPDCGVWGAAAAGHCSPPTHLGPFSSRPAVEGSWARRASRVPMAPAVSRASQARPAPWASRGYKACLASPGNPESRYVFSFVEGSVRRHRSLF